MFRAASEGCQWFHPMERTPPMSNPELAQPFIEQLPLAPFGYQPSTSGLPRTGDILWIIGMVSNGPSPTHPRAGGTGHNAPWSVGVEGLFRLYKIRVFLIRSLPDGGMVAPKGKMGFQRLETLRRRQRRNNGDQRPAAGVAVELRVVAPQRSQGALTAISVLRNWGSFAVISV